MGISKGDQEKIMWNFQGLSFVLSGISRGKVYPQPPLVWIFSGIAHLLFPFIIHRFSVDDVGQGTDDVNGGTSYIPSQLASTLTGYSKSKTKCIHLCFRESSTKNLSCCGFWLLRGVLFLQHPKIKVSKSVKMMQDH